MALTLDKPIVCPALIGRAPQLALWEDVFAAVASGQGQTVLVSGEAGIGKSRLVSELKTLVGLPHVQLLLGNCFEQDRTLPFAPLLDLLRTFLATHSHEAHIQHLAPYASELIKILPELGFWLPDSVETSILGPEQEKRRLFYTLTSVFMSLATSGPVFVIIEDVHWSDDTSLEFLRFLAREVESHPILLLLTYRSNEVHPTLGHFLSGLDRERRAVEFSLTSLAIGDVHLMIQAIFELQRPVRREFLEALYSLTEGNPFFVEEVLKSLLTTGDIFFADGVWDRKPLDQLSIPRSIHDAVQQRSSHLSKAAGETLALAAVAGRHFDFALIQALTQHPENELIQQLETLVAAQLIVEISAERFTFRHALTRQAVYASLMARKRRALHLKIAQTIEQLYGNHAEAHLADLAYHFYEAESWEHALAYSQQIGQQALTLYAPRAALDHFTHAVYAARHLPLPIPISLYRARGQAYELLGDFEAARSDFEQALTMARATQDQLAEWRSLIDLGLLWAGRDYARTGEYFRLALVLAPFLADPALQASSLNRMGNWLINTGQTVEGIAAHDQALALFQELGDKAGLAETLDLLGMANGQYADMPGAVGYFRQAIAIWRELGDGRSLSSSLAACGMFASNTTSEPNFSALVSPEVCVRDAAEAVLLARQTEWSAGQAFAELCLSMILASFGTLGLALAHAHEGLRLANEINHQQWMIAGEWSVGGTYNYLLQPDLALAHFEAARVLADELNSAIWISIVATGLAQAYLLKEELSQAEAALSRAQPRDHIPSSMHERGAAWMWGELTLAQHHPNMALQIADALIESAPGETTGQPIPALLKLRGEALFMLGRAGEAVDVLAEAKRGARERKAQPLLWQIHRSLGRVHAACKGAALVQRELDAARNVLTAIAGSLDDAAQRSDFLEAALATLPREQPLSPRQAAKQAFGGLSEREREVAALIAYGQSSREIAEALTISQRTVETHVEHIYAKLGVNSRVQLAAWVAEKGLTYTQIR